MPEYSPTIPPATESAAPTASLINRSAVKQLALKIAQEEFGGDRVSRVSARFLDSINEHLRYSIGALITENPPTGKTL